MAKKKTKKKSVQFKPLSYRQIMSGLLILFIVGAGLSYWASSTIPIRENNPNKLYGKSKESFEATAVDVGELKKSFIEKAPEVQWKEFKYCDQGKASSPLYVT